MIIDVDRQTAAHLVRALDGHLQWCRTNAIDVPRDVLSLLGHASMLAKNGQPRTPIAPTPETVNDADMNLLAIDFDAAGHRLGVSARTVRRLVAAGSLPAVNILGARRIRVADLTKFLTNLEAA